MTLGYGGAWKKKMRGRKIERMNDTHRLVLVVGSRRILWGVILGMVLSSVLWVLLASVLRGVLAIVLWGVLPGLLWVVLSGLLLVTIETGRFLSVPSEEGLRGILVELRLLLGGLDEGQVEPGSPPPPVHDDSKEDTGDDEEADHGDSNTYTDAQSIPTNDIVVTGGEEEGKSVRVGQGG